MSVELNLSTAGTTAPASPLPRPGTNIVCRRPVSASERAAHFAIRRRIFVDEQAIFTGSDLDAHDRDDSAIALIGFCDEVPAGTVRLYPLDSPDGAWQGDRLAVLSAYRMHGVGAPLVRGAVASAALLGGRVMSAHIQPPNVGFFRRLGWETQGDREIYAGLVHQPMSIELPHPDQARTTVQRLAAGVTARDL